LKKKQKIYSSQVNKKAHENNFNNEDKFKIHPKIAFFKNMPPKIPENGL
jgi:hypothetical protein